MFHKSLVRYSANLNGHPLNWRLLPLDPERSQIWVEFEVGASQEREEWFGDLLVQHLTFSDVTVDDCKVILSFALKVDVDQILVNDGSRPHLP